jgi:hypothetical protein
MPNAMRSFKTMVVALGMGFVLAATVVVTPKPVRGSASRSDYQLQN